MFQNTVSASHICRLECFQVCLWAFEFHTLFPILSEWRLTALARCPLTGQYFSDDPERLDLVQFGAVVVLYFIQIPRVTRNSDLECGTDMLAHMCDAYAMSTNLVQTPYLANIMSNRNKTLPLEEMPFSLGATCCSLFERNGLDKTRR